MKVAVVGVRGMGQGHVAAAQRSKIVRQVAACDLNEQVRQDTGKKFNVPTFADVATLLSDYKPDAVVIATPPSRHGEVARACFDHNVAVLTEKPISATLEDSQSLVDLAAAKNIPYQCCFQLRYGGVTRALNSVMNAGLLGKLSHVGLTQFSGPHQEVGYMSKARTGGIFYEKLCHQVDLFRFIFGEPTRVLATAAPNVIQHYEIHDNVVAVFDFAGGSKGTIRFDTRRAAQIDALAKPEKPCDGHAAGHFYELVYSGDKGSAIYDPWTEELEVIRLNSRADHLSELTRRIHVRNEFGEPSYDLDS